MRRTLRCPPDDDAPPIRGIGLTLDEIEVLEFIQRPCDSRLRDVQCRRQTTHGMFGARFQVDLQEHRQLPGAEIGTIALETLAVSVSFRMCRSGLLGVLAVDGDVAMVVGSCAGVEGGPTIAKSL
jgi:hypothetical protein